MDHLAAPEERYSDKGSLLFSLPYRSIKLVNPSPDRKGGRGNFSFLITQESEPSMLDFSLLRRTFII